MNTYYPSTFVLLALLFGLSTSLKGQDCQRCCYASAALYVQNNESLQNEVKSLFPKLTRKKKSVKFRIDTRIEYMPIYSSFQESVELSLLDSLTHRDSETPLPSFDLAQRFEGFELSKLSDLMPADDIPITLRFSHCDSKYIAAEILDGRLNYGRIRYGKVLHILFIYNDKGFLESTVTSSYTYN